MVAFENGEKLGSLFHNFKINFSVEIQNVYREYFHLEMLKSGRYKADVSLTSRVSGFGLRALTDVFCRYLQVLLSAVVQMVAPWDRGGGRAACMALAGSSGGAPLGHGDRAWPRSPQVALAVTGVQRAVFWCTWLVPHLDLQNPPQENNFVGPCLGIGRQTGL